MLAGAVNLPVGGGWPGDVEALKRGGFAGLPSSDGCNRSSLGPGAGVCAITDIDASASGMADAKSRAKTIKPMTLSGR
jgi:hypothetical protein